MSEDPLAVVPQIIPFVRLQDFKNVYANSLRMKVTPSEFTLFFGIVDEIQPNVNVTVDSVGVVMTPSVVKSLAEVLSQTIAVFEEQHGEIKPPSSKPLNAEKMAAIMQGQKDKAEGKR